MFKTKHDSAFRRTQRSRRLFRLLICLLVSFSIIWPIYAPTVILSSSPSAPQERDGDIINSLQQLPSDSPVSSVTGIIYVHIGKTGGEWLKTQLKMVCKTRRNPKIRGTCLHRPYPLLTSDKTVGYIHASSFYLLGRRGTGRTIPRRESLSQSDLSNFSHFLFTVRHPLDRLISWYRYNHPISCDERQSLSPSCQKSEWKTTFFHCFPTMQVLGEKILNIKKGHYQDPKCYDVLYNMDTVEKRHPNHLYWNFKYYWKQTVAKSQKNKKGVLILRQESLKDDLTSMEHWLGKDPGSKTEWHHADSVHYLRSNAKVTRLNSDAKRNICCYLKQELLIYQSLIHAASNPLNDKERTLQEIPELCKFSSQDELEQVC